MGFLVNSRSQAGRDIGRSVECDLFGIFQKDGYNKFLGARLKFNENCRFYIAQTLMKATDIQDIVIVDETEKCPYLEGQIARMPLRIPSRTITLEEADRRLEKGHRRTGEFIYQTQCPACNACQPIRIPISGYSFSSNQKRVLSRGDRKFRNEFSELAVDPQRVALFNKHRTQRGLAGEEAEISIDEYAWGFVRSCFLSFEITYWLENRLVCLAVCDLGKKSLSAVYTFYDPDLAEESLGTYSILKQIEYCQNFNLDHLYLGYYVADCKSMAYKQRFLPHQKLIDGQWLEFRKPSLNRD